MGETVICNYADETAIYAGDAIIDLFTYKLQKHNFEIASWLFKNFMKLDEQEYHFMLYGGKSNDHSVNVGQALTKECTEEKFLGVSLHERLSFEFHAYQLSIKTSQKLNALARISPFMDSKVLVATMNAFITSKFSYCPLV